MKYPFILLAAAILLLGAAAEVFAQQNPFLSTGNAPPEAEKQTKDTAAQDQFQPGAPKGSGPFFNSAFMQELRGIQKTFQAKISGFITEYKSTGDKKTLSVFLLFSFLYGLLHVLGPGHRKIFLFTYFVSRPAKWKTGMLAGFMTAVLHAVSAIIFIGGLYLITSRTLMTRFNNITPVIERISYGIIIGIGIYLLIHHILDLLKKGQANQSADGKNPDTFIFVLASGLIPCPGAATIMIFSMAVGSPVAGIYAVAAMSLGMASVLSLIPPAAGMIQNRLDPLVSKWKPQTGDILHGLFSITGAVVLILFGLLFII